MSRPPLHVWIPSNRTYESRRNRGKPAPMDGLNEMRGSDRAGKYVGANRERRNLEHCAWHVKVAMVKAGYAPMTVQDRCKCHVYMTIVEPHDRRDVPNVMGGVPKYALDALTARNKGGVGAIWDDNTHWMPKFVPTIRIDPERPGIEFTIIPLEVDDQ